MYARTRSKTHTRTHTTHNPQGKEIGALYKKLHSYRNKVTEEILDKAEVILTTCVGAGCGMLRSRTSLLSP